MILDTIASLRYNAPSEFLPGQPERSFPPYGSRVAMIEMHLQHTTANGTGGFATAPNRRTAKP